MYCKEYMGVFFDACERIFCIPHRLNLADDTATTSARGKAAKNGEKIKESIEKWPVVSSTFCVVPDVYPENSTYPY